MTGSPLVPVALGPEAARAVAGQLAGDPVLWQDYDDRMLDDVESGADVLIAHQGTALTSARCRALAEIAVRRELGLGFVTDPVDIGSALKRALSDPVGTGVLTLAPLERSTRASRPGPDEHRLVADQATPAALRDATQGRSRPWTVISTVGHTRERWLFLHGGTIATAGVVGGSEGTLDGAAADCFVLNGCATAKYADDAVPFAEGLTGGLVTAGARCVVGSVGLKPGSLAENDELISRAAREGWGSAVLALNRRYAAQGPVPPPFVLWGDPHGRPALAPRTSADPSAGEELERRLLALGRARVSLRVVQEMGLAQGVAKKFLSELDMALEGSRQALGPARVSAPLATALRDKLARASQAAVNAELDVLAWLAQRTHRRGVNLTEAYQEAVVKFAQREGCCPDCRSRCTQLRLSTYWGWGREVVDCPRCGYVADLPDDRALPAIRLSAEHDHVQWRVDGEHPLAVAIHQGERFGGPPPQWGSGSIAGRHRVDPGAAYPAQLKFYAFEEDGLVSRTLVLDSLLLERLRA